MRQRICGVAVAEHEGRDLKSGTLAFIEAHVGRAIQPTFSQGNDVDGANGATLVRRVIGERSAFPRSLSE
jgi:hypothetical protein